MTTDTPIVAQSVGTTPNTGERLFPQKITLAATTTSFVVSLRLTNGGAAYFQKNEVIVWYATSPFSITAAAAVDALKPSARYVSVKPGNQSLAVAIKNSINELVAGGFLYLWVEVPTVAVAQTLDVSVLELP